MPTTFLAWELGGGSGHLLEMQGLARRLLDAGHRVFAAVRDVARAGLAFDQASPGRTAGDAGEGRVTLLQAPCKLGHASASPSAAAAEVRVPQTFAHLLHNVGFADARELAALVGAWRCLLDYARPALPAVARPGGRR